MPVYFPEKKLPAGTEYLTVTKSAQGVGILIGTTPFPVARLQSTLIAAFGTPLLPPAGFGWICPIQFLRWGFDVFAVYNAADWMPATTATMYVNHTSGSDTTGDGSAATPYKSLDKAISVLAAATTIYVAGGSSDRNTCWKGRSPAYDVCVLGTEEGVVSSTKWEGGSVTDMGGGARKITRSLVAGIVDEKLKNDSGFGSRLLKVATEAEVLASAGGVYWTDNTSCTWKTQDGRAFDSDLKILLDIANGRLSTDKKVYVRGVSFEGGGAGAFSTVDGTISTNARLVLDSLDLRYAGAVDVEGGNALTIVGLPLAISSNVRAYGNQADGFNYHKGATNSIEARFVELGCMALGNGSTANSNNNDNATTAHDDSRGVRLRTVGASSVGPVFADINTSKTWNIQCVSMGSTGALGVYSTAGFFSLDTATQWLDECVHSGAGAAVYKSAGAFQYARNCTLSDAAPTPY